MEGAISLLETRERTVAILGVPIDTLSMERVIQTLDGYVAEGGFHQIATANVDFLTKSIYDEELREILSCCDLVLPDGMPLIWASQAMGIPLKERVTGADLVPQLVALAATRGYRLFLLGAEEESSKRAAEWMEKNYPGVCIAGRYSPEFCDLDEMDHEEILRRIEIARPDILLVAFGNPKQEKWIAMHRRRLNIPICIGIGASLDFLSGKVSRAPQWMQAAGIEWVHRLSQDPQRLAKRYFYNAACVLRHLIPQLIATAKQKKTSYCGRITTQSTPTATVVRIEGNLNFDLQPVLVEAMCNAIFSGNDVVLDGRNLAYVGPDVLGCLVRLRVLARRCSREIWFTGLQSCIFRTLRAARLGSDFRIAPKVADALRRIDLERSSGIDMLELRQALRRIDVRLIPFKDSASGEVSSFEAVAKSLDAIEA